MYGLLSIFFFLRNASSPQRAISTGEKKKKTGETKGQHLDNNTVPEKKKSWSSSISIPPSHFTKGLRLPPVQLPINMDIMYAYPL